MLKKCLAQMHVFIELILQGKCKKNRRQKFSNKSFSLDEAILKKYKILHLILLEWVPIFRRWQNLQIGSCGHLISQNERIWSH